MIEIKKHKPAIILSAIIISTFGFIIAHNIFKIYSNSSVETLFSISEEKRGTPPFSWILGEDMMPHMKVFFWIPKGASRYTAFADKSIKSYISRHGSVNNWEIKPTGKITKTEKEVYLLVPKSFVLLHGTGFYKLIHIGVAKKG